MPLYSPTTVTIPTDLVQLYRKHACRLPPMSQAAAEGLREALRRIDVEPPSLPPPAKTHAATEACRRRRVAGK